MFMRIREAVVGGRGPPADALAARTCGAAAMIGGLRALARGSAAWSAYWRTEVVPLLEAGFQPPIADGFQRFLSEPQVKEGAEKAAQELLSRGRSDPYDSHPPDTERIAALGSLPSGPDDPPGPPAATLVNGIDGIQPFLLIGILKPGLQMRRITWQDAGSRAMLPGGRARGLPPAPLAPHHSVPRLPRPAHDPP